MKLPFVKSEQQVIEEIHHAFDTAQDRLLKQAQDILSKSVIPDFDEKVIQQSERLKKLGFINTQMAKEGDKLLEKKTKATQQVVSTKEEADLILYYQSKYPFLKFLTEKELDRICDKYKLIHAPVANYIGQVPDKNISDIERAQGLQREDEYETVYHFTCRSYYDKEVALFLKALGKKEASFTKKEVRSLLNQHWGNAPEDWINFDAEWSNTCWWVLTGKLLPKEFQASLWDKCSSEQKNGLFICAPKKDFNLDGLDQSSSKGWFSFIEVTAKDPIVYRYVRGGCQILSKWGLEASDPALLLPQDN